MKKEIITFFFVFFAIFTQIFAQIPSGYYNSTNGKKGKELQIALNQIINNHRTVSYADVWIYYQYTDTKPNGKIWDIYSDNPQGEPAYEYDYKTGQCINIGNKEGVCYAREHSFCQSWFGGGQGAPYSDIFHVYPVDGWINTMRSNNPYGVIANAETTFSNGSKLGKNTYPGAPNDKCFEPIAEFKGDIARSFFYMATRYMFEDNGFQNPSPMTIKSQLQPWALKMLMEWHYEDPVSQKERDRNQNIYAIQKNRNPFIDHPEWVEKIWGNDSINPVLITQERPPEKPKIKWFELTDNRTLKITFTQPMVTWTITNPLNYTIKEAVSITSLHCKNDTLVVHIGGLFSQNAMYQLTVKHLLANNMAFLNDTVITFKYPYLVEQKPLLAWTFDTLQGKPNTPKLIAANFHLLDTVSEAVLYCDGTYGSSDFLCAASGTELESFSGTTLGDPRTSPKAGNAIAFANSTANGKSVVFKFPTKGYFNLSMSMAVRKTATGFDKHQWEWSLDGENYFLIESTATCPNIDGNFVLTTLDLRAIDELDNRENAFLRLTLLGCKGASGNNRFDNITLHGVTIQEHNSIPEKKNDRTFFIAPNPTTGQLRITNYELRITDVEIYDIFGKKVGTNLRVCHNADEILLDISHLPAGIYFLRIQTEKEIITKKVVKY
ncbi:MAG: endonuclease [Bacteroidales bacterium]|jgi:endonuclease I|nr:endonuclease [Bacteroidales bacterium]